MDADIAVSLPEMGVLIHQELYTLADDILLPHTQADIRILYIATAVLQSFLEAFIEENRRVNYNNIDIILLKAYYLSQHPLIHIIQKTQLSSPSPTSTTTDTTTGTTTATTTSTAISSSDDDISNILKKAVQNTSTRIGSSLLVELIRGVEAAKQRLSMADLPSQADSSGKLGRGYSYNICIHMPMLCTK